MIVDNHFLKDLEPVPNTRDIFLAQGTRALKNPGKGEYRTILIGPATTNKGHPHDQRLTDGYTIRGDIKLYNDYTLTWKVMVYSPIPGGVTAFVGAHRATVFVINYAKARDIMIKLAQELVYDRP